MMRVLLFQGSFDPPHVGHLDCLTKALSFAKAEKAIVLANEDNPWKPSMQPLQRRIEMLKLLFQGEQRVEVADEEKSEVRKKLLAVAHVIFLIGSDAWPRFAAKTEIPYPEICIVCREGNPVAGGLPGKTVTQFVPESQGFSSTKVRELLSSHPEWYHQGLSSTNDLPLAFPLRQYIFDRGLYCPKESEKREAIEKSLLDKAARAFPSRNLSLKCLNAIGKGGLSGNLSYVLNDDLAFIKVYLRENGREFFRNERRALKTLNQLALKQCRAADEICWEQDAPDYCHLAVSYIPAPDFGKVWQQRGEGLTVMSFLIGSAMRELHEAKIAPADQETTHKWMEAKKKKTLDLLRKMDLDADLPLAASPSKLTYAHLDPNVGNFIVDIKKGMVYFIDLEQMGTSIGENGEPLGHPEYDYSKFLRSLHRQQSAHPLERFEEIKQAFIAGYGPTGALFTPSVEAFCQARNQLKDALAVFNE